MSDNEDEATEHELNLDPRELRDVAIASMVTRAAARAFGRGAAASVRGSGDNPMMSLTIHNERSAIDVEIYRGHFADCMRWLRYGADAMDRQCRCYGSKHPDADAEPAIWVDAAESTS